MPVIFIPRLFGILAITLLISCDKNPHGSDTQKRPYSDKNTRIRMAQVPTISKYDKINVMEIPAIVEMNDEQRLYLMELVSSIRSVIAGSSTLEVEEQEILGKGDFHWPKDPKKPVMVSKFYPVNNFKIRRINITIDRQSSSTQWNKAGISITPPNFPIGVFSMKLPERFFDDYILKHAFIENRPNENIENPVIFIFILKNNKNMFLTIEARSDVASLTDAYPKSFHLLWLEKNE